MPSHRCRISAQRCNDTEIATYELKRKWPVVCSVQFVSYTIFINNYIFHKGIFNCLFYWMCDRLIWTSLSHLKCHLNKGAILLYDLDYKKMRFNSITYSYWNKISNRHPAIRRATSPLRCALSPHGTTSSAGYLTSPMCPIPAWYHVISRLPHLSDVPYPRMVPRHQQATSPLRCALSPHGTTSSAGYLTSPMCPIPAWYHVISRLPHLSDVPYPRMVPRHQQATSPLRCALSPHGTTSSAGYLTSPMCPIPAWYHVISRLPHLSDVPYPRMVPRHQQATSPLRCALSPHGTTSSAGYLTSPMCPIPAWYHVISRLPHLSDVPYPRMVPRHQQAQHWRKNDCECELFPVALKCICVWTILRSIIWVSSKYLISVARDLMLPRYSP